MACEIKNGDMAMDRITGFKGVVVCTTKWLYGCERLTLQPKGLHEGKPIEMQTFDRPQVLLVPNVDSLEPPKAATKEPGGPRPEPETKATPTR